MKHYIIFALFVALGAGSCTKRRSPSPKSQPPDVPETVVDMQRARIKEAVKDPERRERALVIKDQVARELAQFRRYEGDMMRDVAALGRSYDTSKAELHAHFKALNDRRRGMILRVAKLRMELRKVLRAEEWAKVTEPWRKKEEKKQTDEAKPKKKGEG
jgi:hypothetical protein